MVPSPTQTSAEAALRSSKYAFFFRNYSHAGDWLRQHGFSGLQLVPSEFQEQTAFLPRAISEITEKMKYHDMCHGVSTVSPINEKIIEVPVFAPSAETVKKTHHIRLQDMPPSPLSIDEEYLRAAEVNRRHIAERDRFKNNTNSNKWDSTIRSGQPAKLNPAPTPPAQVQYVDYCKMETYVTRSVAPSALGPLSKTVGYHRNTSNLEVSTSMPNSGSAVKRNFSKNNKNSRNMSFASNSSSWQEKLSKQSESKHGQGGNEYDRLYGGGAKTAGVIKARETELQVNFDRFADRHQPKLWPQLPVRLNFNCQ